MDDSEVSSRLILSRPAAIFIEGDIKHPVQTVLSTIILTAVGREKDNWVLEILILSTDPLSLFLGKIRALSAVGLLQIVIWFESAIGLMHLAGQTFEMLNGVVIPWSSLVLVIPIFLLGYFIFGVLFKAMLAR